MAIFTYLGSILPLITFTIGLVLFIVFLILFLRTPADSPRRKTFRVLWIIGAVVAGLSLLFFFVMLALTFILISSI